MQKANSTCSKPSSDKHLHLDTEFLDLYIYFSGVEVASLTRIILRLRQDVTSDGNQRP